MMFTMDSKQMNDIFLKHENDDVILKAQYVIVSSRIKVSDKESYPNILNCLATLVPRNSVISKLTKEDQEDAYYNQLDGNMGLLATLVLYSITKKYNIIFLCTKKERKMHYIDWIADFICVKFGYPVYDYECWVNRMYEDFDYDEKKVEKYCKKVIEETKEEQHEKQLSTEKGREIYRKNIKNMSKKELKKELKARNLYNKDMDKEDMIDMLKTFV